MSWKFSIGRLSILTSVGGIILRRDPSCYAGDLGRTRSQTWSHRSFEFLGACSSGNTALSLGPESFTTALIWALETLKEEQSKFLVSELSRKIRDAPNFPKDQVPVQLDRGFHAIQRIMLAPLPETSDRTDPTSRASLAVGPQGLLNLNFIFDKPPSKKKIIQFGDALNRFMWQTEMPVNRIVSGGLTSWGGIQPSPGAYAQKLAAVKLFENSGMRRRLGKLKRRASQTMLSGMPTPSSSPDEISQPPTRRRKGSYGLDLTIAVDSDE